MRSPVENASQKLAPNAYTPAVMNNTARHDPVLSRIAPGPQGARVLQTS
jgi:hypothetical protein